MTRSFAPVTRADAPGRERSFRSRIVAGDRHTLRRSAVSVSVFRFLRGLECVVREDDCSREKTQQPEVKERRREQRPRAVRAGRKRASGHVSNINYLVPNISWNL
mgnify:CR=1 FL=1